MKKYGRILNTESETKIQDIVKENKDRFSKKQIKIENEVVSGVT